jgi:hypothetical protein
LQYPFQQTTATKHHCPYPRSRSCWATTSCVWQPTGGGSLLPEADLSGNRNYPAGSHGPAFLIANLTSPEARGEAIGSGLKETLPITRTDMNYLDKTLDFLHRQGWSYGLIRYLDKLTGEEVHQIDAHQGERCEVGRGHNWTEAAEDLMRKIYDLHAPIFH